MAPYAGFLSFSSFLLTLSFIAGILTHMKNKIFDTFNDFLKALDTQDGTVSASFYHPNCTVIFTEGTYRGRDQICGILIKTFSIIKDEKFLVNKLDWNIITDDFATCTFEYNWIGTIQGKRFSTPGRGTLAWVADDGKWFIINEHFSTMPK